MDELLARAGSQAVTFAVKSGVSLASSYAIKTISNFLTQIPSTESKNFLDLKIELENRVDIVSSAIDLIKLVAVRGNTNLRSTLKITENLKQEIDQFDSNIQEQLNVIEHSKSQKVKNEAIREAERYIKDLLRRIQEITPYINLALTTSGVNLSTTLPKTVSPGLLLQASNFVCINNEQFSQDPKSSHQVGPTFEITLFTIFYNINSKDHINWKEDVKRAFVHIDRVPTGQGDNIFKYNLSIKQSFDDERYHNTENGEEIPRNISLETQKIEKVFFSVSGKLLKLEERDSAVLILKINDKVEDGSIKKTEDSIRWFAFGDYEPGLIDSDNNDDDKESSNESTNTVECSKSIGLMEYIIRLTSLQQNDQSDVLSITDERLAIYLNDENPNSIKKGVLDINEVTKNLRDVSLQDSH
ncbi:similar to Saccharomyces cerevisiae YGL164C YRB30 RanGTP-binding protein, inhibits RanGAP1 (Rna1p)-mediated GTP hydrolysis of RanGTP (Gsp1p) [Maudiozyma saulgeensis]|uniref:Similar to Saccharomyces cerevisiae YGL164C YRB30 RanGTP-binding protein, inhibits RanGAP1 (Rna1p)-mediated GTP hydrolysis of RanGTP (Gsp1p) n=1 Tax=Maudiozyma saulgeensis TaxID=1789683 RepID=A0A1X7QZ95_9SACH|nr:similar to Saccharomyces cerevisiae YGL164C YRB30 RanGTP-binding protein, inhibits RanGAP1 (Rna1p)-mediated GTP hydrolysis of RanGTP (Gsp1p) [Kazachstania saulgeensis]